MTKPIQIFFAELAEDSLTEGKLFDGVGFGVFRDMLGREVELPLDDADEIVAVTKAAIEASRTESGELVGLPIDAKDHDKGDAAGWIIDVKRVGDIIRVLPKWTEIGRELISKGIRRFFSATINIDKKIILGGTLTNWPATRNEQGHMLLRPIEMSEGLFTVEHKEGEPKEELIKDNTNLSSEETMEVKEKETEVKSKEPEIIEPAPAVIAAPGPDAIDPDELADLMKQAEGVGKRAPHELAQMIQEISDRTAEKRVERLLQEQQRDWDITTLAAELTGNGVRALPVPVKVMAEFLQNLGQEDFEAARNIFKAITDNGLVEFEEFGHGRRMRKKALPEVYHESLQDTLSAGNSIGDYFEQMSDLGQASDYDLTQFEEAK